MNVALATRRATACAVAIATGTMLCSGAAQCDGPARHASSIPGLPADPAVTARILALDPDALTERDVQETLVHAPAPRIIALHGSLPIVTMEPFARFLIAMGYPDERIRNPQDGGYSYGSFGSSTRLAGMLAWYYEREGMMPMLIGHSQGGMLVVRTLHELAGNFASSVAVWDPVADEPLPRTTIVDPRDGRTRPVVGLDRAVCGGARDRISSAHPLAAMGHVAATSRDSGQRRGIRRLHARVGSRCRRTAGRRTLCGNGPRDRAQHNAAA